MIDAIHSILEYTKELDLEEFAGDRKTVDAVIRNLIVIGEAAVRVPDEIYRENPEIPWFEIRGMRNFVVHEYFRASDKVVWDTVKIDLPPLLKLLEKIS